MKHHFTRYIKCPTVGLILTTARDTPVVNHQSEETLYSQFPPDQHATREPRRARYPWTTPRLLPVNHAAPATKERDSHTVNPRAEATSPIHTSIIGALIFF